MRTFFIFLFLSITTTKEENTKKEAKTSLISIKVVFGMWNVYYIPGNLQGNVIFSCLVQQLKKTFLGMFTFPGMFLR